MVTGATKPLHRQSSNNTTTTHNENLIAEPLNTQQDPVRIFRRSFSYNTQNANCIN